MPKKPISKHKPKSVSKKSAPAVIDIKTLRCGKSCTIKNCKRQYKAKGYCKTHYKKWRLGEYGKARYKTCVNRDCHAARVRNRHGFCEEHFQNYYVKGMAQTKAPAPEKPAAKPASAAAAG